MAEIDDTLNSIKDKSVQAAKDKFQSLLQQLKADSSDFAQKNAKLLEQWLIQLGTGALNKADFDDLIDEQRAAAAQFRNTEEIAGQASARDLALNLFDVALKDIGPALASKVSGGKSSDPS